MAAVLRGVVLDLRNCLCLGSDGAVDTLRSDRCYADDFLPDGHYADLWKNRASALHGLGRCAISRFALGRRAFARRVAEPKSLADSTGRSSLRPAAAIRVAIPGRALFLPRSMEIRYLGPEWFLSDNMRSRILLRMFVSEGWEPLMRVDQYPLLCKFGGLAAILWEIGFVLLVFLPWWRYLAVFVGLSFHWMVKLFLGISFWPIQVLYITFFDWHRLIVWLWGRSRETVSEVDEVVERKLGTRAVTCVATIVLLGNTLCGFILLDSWPFGVYPTFARVIGPTFQSLSFIPVDAEGNELGEIEAFFDPTVRKNYRVGIGRLGGILEHVTRAHPDRPQRLQTIWSQWHEHHAEIQNVAEVRFYMVDYSTVPEHSKEPIGRTLLETITPAD